MVHLGKLDQAPFSLDQTIGINLYYQPLDEQNLEIRVLTLLPDVVNHPIRCKLTCVAAIPSSMPQYTALSYCWGSPHDLAPITVNNSQHFVTKNLEAALRELRTQGYQDLWVDALCINQHDNHEKGHQILRMHDIYKYAKNTIAWLGPDGEGHAEKCFKSLEDLYSQTLIDGGQEASAMTKLSWSDFGTLVALPYWHRTWIIQEVALSPSVLVVWGHCTISLRILRSSLLSIWGDRPTSALLDNSLKDYISMLNLMYILEKGQKPMDLISALRYSCTSMASLTRDKIFGVLGLCNNVIRQVTVPDYEKPLETVVTDMNKRILLHETVKPGDFDILCLGNPRTPRKGDCPSWGVDWPAIWHDPNPRAWTSRAERGLKAGYMACGKSIPSISFPNDNGVLLCRGYILDRISRLSAIDHISATEEVRTSDIEPDINVYTSDERIYNAIWRSILMDRLDKEHAHQPSADYGLMLCSLWSEEILQSPTKPALRTYIDNVSEFLICGRTIREWCQESLNITTDIQTFSSNQKRPLHEALHQNLSFGRRMMTTRSGYIGLSSFQSRSGDLVCLLAGCTMPMVLREEGNAYRFVGEAYVHGVMDGEVWEERSGTTMEEFRLL